MGRNKVSPKQFRQVLATVNFTISDEEFEAIVKFYLSDEDKDVRYVDFIHDTHVALGEGTAQQMQGSFEKIEDLKNTQNFNPLTTTTSKLLEGNMVIDSKLLLDKIRNIIRVGQLRVNDYFKDFDGLRKGIVTSNKFRGVLSKMK